MNIAADFVFRRLEQELHSSLSVANTLGFHDLLSPVITLNGMNSSLTSKHEGFHDELLLHTPFGWLQRTLVIIQHCISHDSKYKKLVESWISLTIQKSRTAHETYATYLSIKSFNKDDETMLLNRHPLEYKQYFWNLSTRIDSTLGSSYLQFIVGKALVTAAFASDIVERLSTLALLQGLDLPDNDSPDFRLASLLAHYEDRLNEPIREAVAECTRQLVTNHEIPSSFVPFSEDGWASLSRKQTGLLDETIMKKLHSLVLNISRDTFRFPVFDFGTKAPSVSSLLNVFRDIGELDANIVSSATLPSELELKRSRLGDVKISNEQMISSIDIGIYSDHRLKQYLRRGNIAVTESLYRGQDEIGWRLIVFGDDENYIYQLDDDILVYALERHRQLSIASGSRDFLETVVFGVRGISAFPSIYARYEDIVSQADHATLYSTAFWYMGGNFVEWIDSELFDVDSRLYRLAIVEENAQGHVLFRREGADDPWELRPEHYNSPTLPPRLFVLWSEMAKGYFVRLMPGYESYKITWKEREPPALGRFDQNERKYLKSVSTKIINGLFLTWPRI